MEFWICLAAAIGLTVLLSRTVLSERRTLKPKPKPERNWP